MELIELRAKIQKNKEFISRYKQRSRVIDDPVEEEAICMKITDCNTVIRDCKNKISNIIENDLNRTLNYFDYKAQKRAFQQIVDDISFVGGAFVVHGEKGYGQKWLVNRLLNKIHIKSKPQIMSHIPFCGREYISEILDKFKEELNSKGEQLKFRRNDTLNSKINKIQTAIIARLRSEDVVLILKNIISPIPNEQLDIIIPEFVRSFWENLLQNIKSNANIKSSLNGRLFLFFIEETEIQNRNSLFSETEGENLQTDGLLLFPKIVPVCEKLLFEWIDNHIKDHEVPEIRTKFAHFKEDDCKEFICDCITTTDILEEIYSAYDLPFKDY